MAAPRNDTIWQQGFVLASDEAVRLGLYSADEANQKISVIISHDCDLLELEETEPFCEILIGTKVSQLDGNFTNAKNPRRLHLSFTAGKAHLNVEFIATDKQKIAKGALLKSRPNNEIQLSPTEQWTIQNWLAIRYYRPSFPDEFDRRLKAKPGDVHKKIGNAVKNSGNDLIAILFDVDGGKPAIDRPPEEPYILSILLVYNVSDDPNRALNTAKTVAQSIRGLFRQYYFHKGQWQGIELHECVPVSEDVVSVYRFRTLKLWHLDWFAALNKKPDS